MLLALGVGCVQAQTSSTPAESWPSITTGQSLDLKVLEPAGLRTNEPAPVVIYLENLAVPRVGSDSDESILRSFLKEGYLVVTLDYDRNPNARVPFL